MSDSEIRSTLAAHNFDFIVGTHELNNLNYPLVAECRRCGKISAARLSDLEYGCECSRNIRSSNPASPRAGRLLLSDSQSPALEWWDPDRNDEATFRTVTVRATRSCHWVCPICRHRFEASVYGMAESPACPECSARETEEWDKQYTQWKTTPISDLPELAATWNDADDPRTVMVADHGMRKFLCENGHQPLISPIRFLESGCPHCRANDTAQSKKWLADVLPEIAAQWHPTRNSPKLNPRNIAWDSKRRAWWQSQCCGHEWQDTVRNRDSHQRLRCPACRSILGSLAWLDPGLAAEWSPNNPVSPWHVRPHAAISFVPDGSAQRTPTTCGKRHWVAERQVPSAQSAAKPASHASKWTTVP
ncbi:zinc-ribbon domain-containing protein [Nocardia crassostreae]|uniref:zinc-ribbon domain-containing protein n=1 Tax=Nocardia crassostreae TaxID=53428 RepID=UPI000ACC411F|nr:zinc-ribbon domain-containing protein [Nocardia crassostreae]